MSVIVEGQEWGQEIIAETLVKDDAGLDQMVGVDMEGSGRLQVCIRESWRDLPMDWIGAGGDRNRGIKNKP